MSLTEYLFVKKESQMKIRNLLVGFVLAMMVLFAGSFTTNTVKADYNCGCQADYDACRLGCNLDEGCIYWCTAWYNCCMNICNGVHSCD
jgi:hypothetical protein